MAIEFDQTNPKRPGTAVHGHYEKYKSAKTVAEARSLGATKSMIRYEVDHGHAKISDVSAVVVLALAATPMPLVEAWCAENSELGIVGERRGRRVIRYTRADDLSKPSTISRALSDIRTRRGTHLHGSIPCTPWTSWQRINLHKAKPETRERILKDRAESLEYVATFRRLARATLSRGGSVSFEWPRHCEGWKEEAVRAMVDDVGLAFVDVDGCRVGVTTKAGEPILKPWRIAVSSPHLQNALQGLRCEGGHKHAPCAGAETARSAFYPEELCNAIHDGLDAHENGCAAVERDKSAVEHEPSAAVCAGDLCSGTATSKPTVEPVSSDGAPSGLSGSGEAQVDDPMWELFCLEHGMHAIAQDDEQSTVVPSHRPLRGVAVGMYCGLVTRVIPATDPESKSEGCLKALLKETNKLRDRTVWREDEVQEWSTVRKRDPTASVGRVFSILGEKNAEAQNSPENREYKARIVFAGNAIQTASGCAPHELFQEISSAPAAMASVRAVLGVAALRGWIPRMRDASQAYLQARIDQPGRPRTWVRLPKGWWPKAWFGPSGEPLYQDPVCPLQRALYGHPEAGALWEKHLGAVLTSLGWVKVPSHPGTWTHSETSAVLAVYVDDLLLVASEEHQAKLWRDLELQINFDEPAVHIGRFLGAYHKMKKSGNLTEHSIQMEEFLIDAVQKYEKEVGASALAPVRTPYLPESFSGKDKEAPGQQSKTCSSHLMKLLFSARLARPDLTVAITRLASKVTSWNLSHDRALRRLMQYVKGSAGLELRGSLSTDDLSTAILVMSPDADLANDLETSKSTSGLWLELQSACGTRCWPLSWRSKRQGSTASSTCEAEVISAATALKAEALPMLDLLEQALGRKIKLLCLEDNTQCIAACNNGYSKACAHLARTERIAHGVLHEVFIENIAGPAEMRHEPTETHKGDMFTKRLDPGPFESALQRISLVAPTQAIRAEPRASAGVLR